MKKIYRASFIYALIGLALGVFYREYTKFNDFYEHTELSNLHVHALVLGMMFFLIVLLLDSSFKLSESKRFNGWFALYNVSLLGVLASMMTRGILTVNASDFSGLNHLAGSFHALLGISIIWFFIILKNKID